MSVNKESAENDLARVAGQIMFGDRYLDLLEEVYCDHRAMQEFEADPGRYLRRHGIEIPAEIEVVLHDKGAIGKPGRIDFHWGEGVEKERARKRQERQKMRELAAIASQLIHSEKLKAVVRAAASNQRVLKELAADPKAYLKGSSIDLPDEMEVILHNEGDLAGPRIDLHFSPANAMRRILGCYYCSGDVCCCYAA